MKTLTDNQIISILNLKELVKSVKAASVSNSTGTFVDIHLNQNADLTECQTALAVIFPNSSYTKPYEIDNEDGTYGIYHHLHDPSGVHITIYADYSKKEMAPAPTGTEETTHLYSTVKEGEIANATGTF